MESAQTTKRYVYIPQVADPIHKLISPTHFRSRSANNTSKRLKRDSTAESIDVKAPVLETKDSKISDFDAPAIKVKPALITDTMESSATDLKNASEADGLIFEQLNSYATGQDGRYLAKVIECEHRVAFCHPLTQAKWTMECVYRLAF
jgi:hypothetical protein